MYLLSTKFSLDNFTKAIEEYDNHDDSSIKVIKTLEINDDDIQRTGNPLIQENPIYTDRDIIYIR